MSAIPTGVILEAVNRGESSLPALKRATGFDYPVLLTALEGDLSMAVRREETVDGFPRFHPLDYKPEAKIERIPVGPLCVKCRVECKKTHQAGMAAVGGEARWKCPKCHEKFPGTHTKRDAMVKLSDYEAADHRLNEIIAAGQKPRTDEQILTTPRTEAEDLCGCGKARGHRGICGKRVSATRPVATETPDLAEKERMPKLCAECGAEAAQEGGTLCWDCDAAKIEAGLAEVELAPTPIEEPVSPVGDRGLQIELRDDAPAPPSIEDIKIPYDGQATRPKPVSIDGSLRMNISINIDPGEMVKWGSLRISNFWEGLAKTLRAMNGE